MILIVVFVVFVATRLSRARGHKPDRQTKYRENAIRKANQVLRFNPKNTKALLTLADLYYEGEDFVKAMHTYELIKGDEDLDDDTFFRINSRFGISAFQAKKWSQAYSSLLAARKFSLDNFEVNKYLGQLEFRQKNYAKAIQYLAVSLRIKPNDTSSMRYIGQSFYAIKKYSRALDYLKYVTTAEPEDNVSLYKLACSYYHTEKIQKAKDIFVELRYSPEWWGSYSAIYYGDICTKRKDLEEAIESYQLGLGNSKLPEPLFFELKYKLARAMIQNKDIKTGLGILNEIYESSPNYKDVAEQIQHYRQINSNKNLKFYIMGSMNEFIVLCREIVKKSLSGGAYVGDSNLRTQGAESLEMIVKVMNNGKEESLFVKFVRTEGLLGELFVRDLYSRFSDIKATKCICFSAGEYSTEALNFAQSRLIDLVNKGDLIEKMKAINLASLMAPF